MLLETHCAYRAEEGTWRLPQTMAKVYSLLSPKRKCLQSAHAGTPHLCIVNIYPVNNASETKRVSKWNERSIT